VVREEKEEHAAVEVATTLEEVLPVPVVDRQLASQARGLGQPRVSGQARAPDQGKRQARPRSYIRPSRQARLGRQARSGRQAKHGVSKRRRAEHSSSYNGDCTSCSCRTQYQEKVYSTICKIATEGVGSQEGKQGYTARLPPYATLANLEGPE